jgi:hypothetical protein
LSPKPSFGLETGTQGARQVGVAGVVGVALRAGVLVNVANAGVEVRVGVGVEVVTAGLTVEVIFMS